MLIATTSLILGFSWLGAPGKLGLGMILLLVSTAAWFGFIQIEKRAEAPILDPQVLFNRVFITAASAGFLSFFGALGIMAYSPIFAQDVMKVSPSVSGSMLTPFTVILAVMGIVAGVLLARTKKYKWMYNIGYAIVTLALFTMWRFSAVTPVWLYMLVTAVAGFGLGAIPTVNTLVAQFAVQNVFWAWPWGPSFSSRWLAYPLLLPFWGWHKTALQRQRLKPFFPMEFCITLTAKQRHTEIYR
jgi:hypothetical protein